MSELFKVGDSARTPDQRPIGWGTIRVISECGRYALLTKSYGHQRMRKHYKISELEPIKKR